MPDAGNQKRKGLLGERCNSNFYRNPPFAPFGLFDFSMTEPEHHTRYKRAWSLYQEEGLCQESRKALEKEMDSAQNHFSWDEFQDFKETLPGFNEFWENISNSADKIITRLHG